MMDEKAFILYRSSFILSSAGFTLAESLIASVVLAIVVVAVSGAMIASASQSLYQEESGSAAMLARQLMERIVSTPIVLADGTTGQAGWPSVTDPDLYDTVDDFNGYTDTLSISTTHSLSGGTGSPSVSATGASPLTTVVLPSDPDPTLAPQQYKRTVSIAYPSSMFGTTIPAGDVAIVTVKVQGGASGASVELVRLISKVSSTR